MLKEGTFLRNVLKNIIIALLLSALPTGLLLHQDFKQQHAAAPAVQTTKIVSAKTTAKQTTTVTTHKTAPETTRRSASSPYASIAVSQKDIDVLERLVYFESRGEHGEAVVEIVLNRVLSPSFPNTIQAVVYQAGQFSPASHLYEWQRVESRAVADCRNDVARVLNPNYDPMLPSHYLYFNNSQAQSADYRWLGGNVYY